MSLMVRLGVIVPVPGLDKQALKKREVAYRRYACDSTELIVVKTHSGPESTDSRYEEVLAGPAIISAAKRLSASGLNAIIVSCFGDPAVGALREILDFPVVGPGEASLLTAMLVGDRFSIVTILDNGVSMLQEQLRRIGLSDRLASVRAINIAPQELEIDLSRTEDSVKRAATAAIEHDGASALVVGCTSPDMALVADRLRKSVQVPVINPVSAAVNTALSLARQQLQNSRKTYPRPISLSYPNEART